MEKHFAKLEKIPVHPPNATGYSAPIRFFVHNRKIIEYNNQNKIPFKSLLKSHLKRVNAILLSGTSSSPEMSSITLKSNILISRYIFFQFLLDSPRVTGCFQF